MTKTLLTQRFFQSETAVPTYFYFDKANRKRGPVSEEQLKQLASQGIVGLHTPMETYTGHKVAAWQIPGLLPDHPSPLAIPQRVPVPIAGISSLVITLIGFVAISLTVLGAWMILATDSSSRQQHGEQAKNEIEIVPDQQIPNNLVLALPEPPHAVDPVVPQDNELEQIDVALPERETDIEARELLFANATHLEAALRASGFTEQNTPGFIRQRPPILENFATFGTLALRERLAVANTALQQAENNLRRAVGTEIPPARARVEQARDGVEQVRTMIRTTQMQITSLTFFGDWTYLPSAPPEPIGGQNNTTLTIPLNLQCSEFRSLALNDIVVRFPTMPNVTVSSIAIIHSQRNIGLFSQSDRTNIVLAVSGDAASIQTLYRNRNNFRARVWFTNLRSGTDPSVPRDVENVSALSFSPPSAEILGIAIIGAR